MFEPQPLRQAPFSLAEFEEDPTRPAVPDEPVLRLDNIQGNIIGFNKDHQTFILLKISNIETFRNWLGSFIPFVATACEVLMFNKLFKELKTRRRSESRTIQATWINIALSFECLQKLSGGEEMLLQQAQSFPLYKDKAKTVADVSANSFADAAFKEGLAARAVSELSDPLSEQAEGNPQNWLFGGTDNKADALIIVASDSLNELNLEISRIESSIYAAQKNAGEKFDPGFEVVFKQYGSSLPPPMSAREHFGFVDNISQPGLRGRISEKETDVLTLRQDPDEPNNGKPGQEMIWTGEFVFGYPTQSEFPDPKEPTELNRKPGPVADAGPVWADDGSFLVVRRLRQDVKAFHDFLNSKSNELGINADYLGAKLVGRWRSGAPVIRVPFNDDPALGANDCANNNFEFLVKGEMTQNPVTSPNQCHDQHPDTAQPDPKGLRCPFAAHIRKVYPRDDASTLLGDKMNENLVQNRRLLRRGIPFGDLYHPELDTEQTPDSGNRGLMFLCYQTSIVEQFEFIQKNFSNDPEFKDKSENGVLQTGHDFIIGQSNGEVGKRTRTFVLPLEKNENTELIEIKTETDWVIPTGGGYFFQPSISALELLSSVKPDDS